MREVELKSLVPDFGAVIRALHTAGAVTVLDGRLTDARYDTPGRTLLAQDRVLRLRTFDGSPAASASLDWKGPTATERGYKVREEISTPVGDAAELARILEGLGYVVIGEIQRHISQFTCRGAVVRLERYPRMDTLVEIEGEPAAIESAIAATGLPRAGFTAERLLDFVARYEARTGERAALNDRELAGDHDRAANA
jgi:predicted adenylyl cyclase CyaB